MSYRRLLLPLLAAPALLAGDRSIGALSWKPTTQVAATVGVLDVAPFAGARIFVAPFTDNRAEKDLLGENHEDSRPRYMAHRQDAAAFLSLHMADVLRSAGLPLAAKSEEATVTLGAEVMAFKVIEKDDYVADTRFKVQLQAGGQVIWSGEARGAASHFGRSFDETNYNETLSDSVVNLAGSLLKNPDFMKALRGTSISGH